MTTAPHWVEEYFAPPGPALNNESTGTMHNVVTTEGPHRRRYHRFLGAAPSITGFASGAPGRPLTIYAVGGAVLLNEENSGSLAANRIVTGAGNLTIPQGAAADLVYDEQSTRWRVVTGSSSGGGGGGEANTSSNTGAGAQLAKAKVGVNLPFRTLVAGANVTVTQNTDTVTIASTGGGGSTPTGTGWRRVVSGVEDAAASAVNLAGGATHVTGTLPVANGGTGAATHTSGNVLVGAGTGAVTSRLVREPKTLAAFFGANHAHLWASYNGTTGALTDSVGAKNAAPITTTPAAALVSGVGNVDVTQTASEIVISRAPGPITSYPTFLPIDDTGLVTSANVDTLNGSNSWTVYALFRASGEDSNQGAIVAKALQIYLELDSTGVIAASNYSGGFDGSRVVNDGEWHRVIYTQNGATVSMYVDGVADGSQGGQAALSTASNPMRFGSQPSVATMNGGTVIVGIATRGVSAAEVPELDSIIAGYAGSAVSSASDAVSAAGTCTLEQFGAVGDGVTSDQAAFEAARLALVAGTYSTLELGAKTYLVSGTVDPTNGPFPFGISIVGQGPASVLKTTTDGPVILLRDTDAADRAKPTLLRDFRILGNSTGSAQNGIELGYLGGDGSSYLTIRNVDAENLGTRGFSIAYGQQIGAGPHLEGCRAIKCVTRGFSLHDQCNLVNCEVIGGPYGGPPVTALGAYVGSGNVEWNGGGITGCTKAAEFVAGGNDGHGIFNSVQINHNTTALDIQALANGFTFSSCHLYQGNLTVAANTGLVEFNNCVLDITTYSFTSSKVKFSNCRIDQDYFSAYNESGAPDVEWLNCRGMDPSDDGDIPSFIGQRVRLAYTFPSDANQSLTAQQSRAQVIDIAAGVITATRGLTSTRPPNRANSIAVVNRTAQSVEFYWATGNGIVIPTLKTAIVDADGTHAVCRLIVDNVAAGVGGLDPTTLALATFVRGDYASSPWSGVASAGSSGSRDYVAGTAPSVGAALNGYDSADFTPASSHHLILGGGLLTSDAVSTTAARISFLVEFDTVPAPAGAPYDDPAIFADGGGNLGVTFNTSGIHCFWFDTGTSTYKTASSAAGVTTGTKYAVDVVISGGNVTVSVNAVAGTPVALGTMGSIAGACRIGRNYASLYSDMRLWDFYTAQTALAGTTAAQHKAYINARYGLSL